MSLNSCGARLLKPTEDKVTELSGVIQFSPSLRLDRTYRDVAISDYRIACKSLTLPSQVYAADFAQDGHFSLSLPPQVPIACAIEHRSTGQGLAIMALEDTPRRLGSIGVASFALQEPANLGELAIGGDGVVLVPAGRLPLTYQVSDGAQALLNRLHDSTYMVECEATDNAVQQQCRQMLTRGVKAMNTLYVRVLRGIVDDNQSLAAFGIWQSRAGFDACGSIDMTVAEAATTDIDFTQNQTGSMYSESEACPLDSPNLGRGLGNLQPESMLTEAVAVGDGWTVFAGKSASESGGCQHSSWAELSVLGSGDILFGSIGRGKTSENCPEKVRQIERYAVRFVRQ